MSLWGARRSALHRRMAFVFCISAPRPQPAVGRTCEPAHVRSDADDHRSPISTDNLNCNTSSVQLENILITKMTTLCRTRNDRASCECSASTEGDHSQYRMPDGPPCDSRTPRTCTSSTGGRCSPPRARRPHVWGCKGCRDWLSASAAACRSCRDVSAALLRDSKVLALHFLHHERP